MRYLAIISILAKSDNYVGFPNLTELCFYDVQFQQLVFYAVLSLIILLRYWTFVVNFFRLLNLLVFTGIEVIRRQSVTQSFPADDDPW